MPVGFEKPKRVDLHCHCVASNRPAEAVLKVLNCPESYSEAEGVYAQAMRRGMDFVTLTDHDVIDGALSIAHHENVIVGEELTAYFPEDGCKMHIVLWGISKEDHQELQRLAADIYVVADYLEAHNIAHAVAHPLYRQNEKLERWHVERLIVLFKGFECLNGAHSPLHRQAFEPLLDKLDEEEVQRLAEKHRLRPHWPEPHIKARTGGSDDHGLLHVGRTWTEFPADTTSVAKLLEHIRHGQCRPGGESGSSIKLAHTFYAVAIRYYSRHVLPAGVRPNPSTQLLQVLVGEGDRPTARQFLWHKLRKFVISLVPPIFRRKTEAATIRELFLQSAREMLKSHPELITNLDPTLPPLSEPEEVFGLIGTINREIAQKLIASIGQSIDTASFTGLFNAIAGILAQQFVLLPYYFALFHQNKERKLLRGLTGELPKPTARTLKVGLFTDTLDETNGVSRFLCDLSRQAERNGWKLTILTCASEPCRELPGRRNFVPVSSHQFPYYPELNLSIPPLLEIMEFADREQFDVVHISTPGPMGLMGLLVSRMLRIPALATYHTDFPAYAQDLTRDHRAVRGTMQYLRWFYGRTDGLFARSREYQSSLRGMGMENCHLIHPAIDCARFSAGKKNEGIWEKLKVNRPHRLLYVGRLSAEKNLDLLATAFALLCEKRKDVALVLAGDGPSRSKLQKQLAGLPAWFVGQQGDQELASLYASADLLVFPSRTDTLGQVVLEALSCGLPALVSSDGGPQELVEDGTTGMVLPPTNAGAWASAIGSLLDDPALRRKMGQAAREQSGRISLSESLLAFWNEHLHAADGETEQVSSTPAGLSLQSRP